MAGPPSEALAPRQATYQDVLDAPAHLIAELVNGSLHTRPRPAPGHGEATSVLVGELNPPFHRGRGGPGGWRIHFEPELHLAEDIIATAKDDEPVSVRPFDAITFSLGDLRA